MQNGAVERSERMTENEKVSAASYIHRKNVKEPAGFCEVGSLFCLYRPVCRRFQHPICFLSEAGNRLACGMPMADPFSSGCRCRDRIPVPGIHKGTNLVLSTLHAKSEIPFKTAPLIFITTILTHLFGGSAGREGAALQLGGSIGQQLGRFFRFDEKDQRIVVMCGMSAAFSAIFGTPVAAAIFSLEVGSIGIMYYAALVPCVFSALVASKFAVHMGIGPDVFHLTEIPSFQLFPSIKIIGLALCCAALSALFCISLHSLGDVYRKHLKNPYIRILLSSAVILLLTAVLQTDDYMGAGVPVIERAIDGSVSPPAFILKIIFTALTLEAGFKGGEIVPSFFVGATFGCLFGQICGISPSLCAAVGMMSIFCGVTNCPITSLLISFELFGYEAVPYFLLGISISYLMSGYYGLYHDQTIVYSKYKTEFINRRTRE